MSEVIAIVRKRGRPPKESHTCACGQPAVTKDRGAWVCVRCLAFEKARYGTGRRASRSESEAHFARYSPNAKYAEWMLPMDRGHKTPVVHL
jgi:hypothetical protein